MGLTYNANGQRNAAAVAAWNRNSAGYMKDRRKPRGGSRNMFREFMSEAETFNEVEKEVNLLLEEE